jgi:hypothetical protein
MRHGYDRDGYVLLSKDLEHSAEFSWASHQAVVPRNTIPTTATQKRTRREVRDAPI